MPVKNLTPKNLPKQLQNCISSFQNFLAHSQLLITSLKESFDKFAKPFYLNIRPTLISKQSLGVNKILALFLLFKTSETQPMIITRHLINDPQLLNSLCMESCLPESKGTSCFIVPQDSQNGGILGRNYVKMLKEAIIVWSENHLNNRSLSLTAEAIRNKPSFLVNTYFTNIEIDAEYDFTQERYLNLGVQMIQEENTIEATMLRQSQQYQKQQANKETENVITTLDTIHSLSEIDGETPRYRLLEQRVQTEEENIVSVPQNGLNKEHQEYFQSKPQQLDNFIMPAAQYQQHIANTRSPKSVVAEESTQNQSSQEQSQLSSFQNPFAKKVQKYQASSSPKNFKKQNSDKPQIQYSIAGKNEYITTQVIHQGKVEAPTHKRELRKIKLSQVKFGGQCEPKDYIESLPSEDSILSDDHEQKNESSDTNKVLDQMSSDSESELSHKETSERDSKFMNPYQKQMLQTIAGKAGPPKSKVSEGNPYFDTYDEQRLTNADQSQQNEERSKLNISVLKYLDETQGENQPKQKPSIHPQLSYRFSNSFQTSMINLTQRASARETRKDKLIKSISEIEENIQKSILRVRSQSKSSLKNDSQAQISENEGQMTSFRQLLDPKYDKFGEEVLTERKKKTIGAGIKQRKCPLPSRVTSRTFKSKGQQQQKDENSSIKVMTEGMINGLQSKVSLLQNGSQKAQQKKVSQLNLGKPKKKISKANC